MKEGDAMLARTTCYMCAANERRRWWDWTLDNYEDRHDDTDKRSKNDDDDNTGTILKHI